MHKSRPPKNQTSTSSSDSNSGSTDSIPFTTNDCMEPRKIIDLFEVRFRQILESPNLQEQIQTVKGHLYHRDYISAFDNNDKRFAYAARWTPARALSYSSLFASLEPIRDLLKDPDTKKSVLCVGGGASAELVALGSVFCRLKEYCSGSASELEIQLIDIADWKTVVDSLTSYMKENWIYRPEKLNTKFICDDVLTVPRESLSLSSLDLVTLLFTTNELFAEKRKETIRFLQNLNSFCKPGSLLLIAESAGSYSHITIGEKKFPIQFLIDTILVGKPGENNGAWEIVQQSESCWYRIEPKQVDYPMKLENMRFFYRLYRKR
ncbi:25S rRNA [Spathaspora sp. JA1]|nr:25S rRNA [Spathaspora sp. JA1]